MEELSGKFFVTAETVKEANNESCPPASATSNLLPMAFVVPKNFSAVFSVTTIACLSLRQVFGFPYNKGKEKTLKKVESAKSVERLNALSEDFTFSIISPENTRA